MFRKILNLPLLTRFGSRSRKDGSAVRSFSESIFAPAWYLRQYPDVAAAGIDPWMHFDRHGRAEGRFAHPDHVALWFDESAFLRARSVYAASKHVLSDQDKAYFCWIFARRFAALSFWLEATRALAEWGSFEKIVQQPIGQGVAAVLWIDALIKSGQFTDASACLKELEAREALHAEMVLLRANLLRLQASDGRDKKAAWVDCMNSLYRPHGLVEIELTPSDGWLLDQVVSPTVGRLKGPLVSVLMAAHNAAATIDTAIRSVLSQTWANLELIVVDDGSTDQTAGLVEAASAHDERVRLLRLPVSQGAYAARNHALDHASGDFVTVHDADDWSHPEKIQRQVQHLLKHDELRGCFSSWVRVRSDLVFGIWDLPSSWLGWVHRNTSSLMLRRDVFHVLGYWDELRCNADSEFVDRIKAAWGPSVLETVLPKVPLALGRTDQTGLTRRSDTHLLTALKGARLEHMRAYTDWHRAAASPADLYLPRRPDSRPFAVPASLLPGQGTSG